MKYDRVLFPHRGQDTDRLVVPRKAVDAGLDQDEVGLGILVLAIVVEMLADRDSLYH